MAYSKAFVWAAIKLAAIYVAIYFFSSGEAVLVVGFMTAILANALGLLTDVT